jgi:hypothetical protein
VFFRKTIYKVFAMERFNITIPLMAALVIAAVFRPDFAFATCFFNNDCLPGQYCQKMVGDCDGIGQCAQMSEWRPIATSLEFDRWHTVAVVCDVFNDIYDVYVNGAIVTDRVQAYADKDKVTHISFAQFSGAPATFYVDNLVTPLGEETKLLASDGAEICWFGNSVAISGNVALVGAYGDEDNGSYSGAAYVFRRIGKGWVKEQKLIAEDGASRDYFGQSVAISGNVALVGARRADQDIGDNAGAVYVYNYVDAEWKQKSKLGASDWQRYDSFGTSVSIADSDNDGNGDLAVIGAPTKDDGNQSGSAYIFRYKNGEWIEGNKLRASMSDEQTYFGSAVVISGNVVGIGKSG